MTSPISIWRNREHRFQLYGVMCQSCSAKYYPKKYVCLCGEKKFQKFQFSGKACLVSYTQITAMPASFKHDSVYCIGLVELEEGPRILAQITSVQLSDLFIGQELCAVLRKYSADGEKGIISYGVKFIPKEML
ncbi:MAG: OB-fold domain-containing protein [bacterium]